MLLHHLKTTFRFFKKHPFTTFINFVGLVTGLCFFLFAIDQLHFDYSYDDFHQQGEQIYRMVSDLKDQSGIHYESTSAPMSTYIHGLFPEIKQTVRVFPDYMVVQNKNNGVAREEKLIYVDSSFFKMFTFPLVKGRKNQVLQKPFQVVLSPIVAERYFGTLDCIGNTLYMGGDTFTVSGIMEEMPVNTHLRSNILVSMSTLVDRWNPNLQKQWDRFGFYTYLLLEGKSNVHELEKKISSSIQPNFVSANRVITLKLEPLEYIYLKGKPRGSRYGTIQTGNIEYTAFILLVAIGILTIAGFNFINLTMALSFERSEELKTRRAFGATRTSLLSSILLDAIIMCTITTWTAVGLRWILNPVFDQLAGRAIREDMTLTIGDWVTLLLIPILLGFLSGIYPAIKLSVVNFNQSHGSIRKKSQNSWIRKPLLILQFSASFILIFLTILVGRQIKYMKDDTLGFASENKMVIDFHFDDQIVSQRESIKQSLLQIPGISSISFSSSVPGKNNRKYQTLIQGKDGQFQDILADAYFVDEDFLNSYEISLMAGRPFAMESGRDSLDAMIINQAMVHELGYAKPENVIGKSFEQKGRKGTIIGVVENFKFHSVKEAVRPLTIRISPGWNIYSMITLTVSPEEFGSTIQRIENTWSDRLPDQPLIFFFEDEAIAQQYMAESRFSFLFTSLSFIGILISCLGLSAMVLLNTRLVTREISIRKVLGAETWQISWLLIQHYLKAVLLAIMVGIPIANFVAYDWLNQFAYKVRITWWDFGLPILVLTLVSIIVLILQTFKTSIKNPVAGLRQNK